MTLNPGTRLGPYEIVALLGAGGMGEVYRATDVNLKRQVAVKVLPAPVAGDAERLARFQREAEVLAALNHPNIAHIHGLEKSDGNVALVMELVEGPTLADRLEHGAIPIDEAVSIARQIAEALEAAHEQGIVHRDLKPANIKIRTDGTVKVLDFGLAKALDSPASSSPDLTQSPTLTVRATIPGLILGTAAYMSPEQARGKIADRRSDIWSFGVVLFEMLTGTRAFDGESISDVLAKVIEREPDWTKLPESTPRQLRTLLQRSLRKDSRTRIQAIGDARVELQELMESREVIGPATIETHQGRRRTVALVGLALATLAILSATVAAGLRRPAPPKPATLRFAVQLPKGWRLSNTQASAGASVPLAISPDGRRIAFVARQAGGKDLLMVRSMDSLEARALPGTEGATAPFWSADSRSIGFAANGKLKRINTESGSAFVVCDLGPFRGGTWNAQDVILFATNVGGLQRVSASGGTPTRVTEPQEGELYHSRPVFLPDGRHFLFRTMPSGEVFVGAIDSHDRALVLRGSDSTNLVYSDGHLLFLRGRTLMAQPFDEHALRTTGEPFPVADEIRTQNPPGTENQIGIFSASSSGALVFLPGSTSMPRLTWFDRSGRPAGVVGDPAFFQSISISHDGKRAAVHINDTNQRNQDVWIVDLEQGSRTQLTFERFEDSNPVWSFDDSEIFFASRKTTNRDIYAKASNGVGDKRLVVRGNNDMMPWNISSDGQWLLYQVSSPKTGSDLWLDALGGDKSSSAFLETPFAETLGQISPDSRWVAYTSNETGQPHVYVVPLRGSAKGKWRVSSNNGGRAPRWRADSKELFYLDAEGMLVGVNVNGSGEVFGAGPPQPLFKTKLADVTPVYFYDTEPKGQRFLMIVTADEDAESDQPITAVLNWSAEHSP